MVTQQDPVSKAEKPYQPHYLSAVRFQRIDGLVQPGVLGRVKIEAGSQTLWWRFQNFCPRCTRVWRVVYCRTERSGSREGIRRSKMAKKRPTKNGAAGGTGARAGRPTRGEGRVRETARLKALTDKLREGLAELLRTDEKVENALADLVAVGADAAQRSERARHGLKVKVVIYPDEVSGFTAVVPALPGCVTEAETRAELLANLREAIEGYLLCTQGNRI